MRSLGVASFHNVRLGSEAHASQRGAHFFSVGVVTSHASYPDESHVLGTRGRKERDSCLRYTTPLAQLGEEIAAAIATCPELDLTLVEPLLTGQDRDDGASDTSSDFEDGSEEQGTLLQRKATAREIAVLLKDFYAQMSQPQVAQSLPTDNSLLLLQAVHSGFGPLLPKLLKLLLPDYLAMASSTGEGASGRFGPEAGRRVLVYCPPGNPLYTASMFALNLLTVLDCIAHRGRSALSALVERNSQSDPAAQDPGDHHDGTQWQQVPAPRYRGYLSLHDLFDLEEEDRTRWLPEDDPRFAPAARTGWVAVTTDRVMIERPRFFDVLVDLSNLMASGTGGAVRAGGAAALAQMGSSARIYTEENRTALPTVSVAQTDPSGRRLLTRINWTNADFGNWNSVEERGSELRDVLLETVESTRSKAQRQPSSSDAASLVDAVDGDASADQHALAPAPELAVADQGWGQEEDPHAPGQLRIATQPVRPRAARRSRVMSTLAAFLRYYFAGWGWLTIAFMGPLNIIPLGIRDDGGARYTLLLGDDNDTLGEQDEEDTAEAGGTSGGDVASRSGRERASTDSPFLAAAGGGSLSPRALDARESRHDAPSTSERGGEAPLVEQLLLTLAQAWCDWGADLIAGLGRTVDAACAAASLEAETLPGPLTLHVHARTLRGHGVDARDATDRALVEAVAGAVAPLGSAVAVSGQWSVFF